MITYFFKDQRIEEPLRDEMGVLVKEDDKTKNVDYKSIQLKVPVSMCTIDFDEYSRYSPMYLITPLEYYQLISKSPEQVSDNEKKLATIAYLENRIDDIKDSLEETKIEEG